MASKLFLLLALFSSLHLLSVNSLEFDVGESQGWVIPPSNDIGFYNEWASKNRFQIGDTVVFKYKDDSVMVVSEEDYEDCNATHPIFFGNGGETSYTFNQSGPFYFISGVLGHCEKGQKMIIKVLSKDTPEGPPNPSDQPSAAVPGAGISYILIPFVLFLGSIFHQFY